MPHPEHTETTGHLNRDPYNDNRLYLRSEEVQEILGRPPRRIVRWGSDVKINFQKTGNALIFCLILHSKIFRMFEARSTKHEARSTKPLLFAAKFPASRGICAELSSYGK